MCYCRLERLCHRLFCAALCFSALEPFLSAIQTAAPCRFRSRQTSQSSAAFLSRPALAAKGFDSRVTSLDEAASQAAHRAKELIDADVGSALLDGSTSSSAKRGDGGLVVLQNALGLELTAQLREEAETWRNEDRFRSMGQPGEKGRSDRMCFVDAPATRQKANPGIAYGSKLLCAVCTEINKYVFRSGGECLLEPGPLQLACYEGGAAYTPHKDGSPASSLANHIPNDVPEFVQQELIARRITAILYLQTRWDKSWGGTFRAHCAAEADSGEASAGYVDVDPGGGTLVLFRSRDLLHEVLPATHRRFALTMWFLEANDWARNPALDYNGIMV